ncbi:hypothetical protein KEM48_003103 [Puccinia striiformis f. sp. tritici PST-130]|nr:hypothetical protein H4Q26_003161 [Puccinia striiformis f. sp. tritici PST-130]KAI9609020.1 hypothetical protein KEM48_003103 [Puccinia striiformis f. sp. tritici PST-130]
MSIMSSVQRGCGTLVIIALIISLQLNHAAATTKVACDVHFWADEGPNPRISYLTAVQDKDGNWWQCNYYEDGDNNRAAVSQLRMKELCTFTGWRNP